MPWEPLDTHSVLSDGSGAARTVVALVPDNAAMSSLSQRQWDAQRKSDQDLLIKGIILVMIGLVIVVSPYVASGDIVQGVFAKAPAVGWFSLVLGAAFVLRFGLRRKAVPPRPEQ